LDDNGAFAFGGSGSAGKAVAPPSSGTGIEQEGRGIEAIQEMILAGLYHPGARASKMTKNNFGTKGERLLLRLVTGSEPIGHLNPLLPEVIVPGMIEGGGEKTIR
jgi:hypothetical protein